MSDTLRYAGQEPQAHILLMVTSIVPVNHHLVSRLGNALTEVKVLSLAVTHLKSRLLNRLDQLFLQHHTATAHSIDVEQALFGPPTLGDRRVVLVWHSEPGVPYQSLHRQMLVDAVETGKFVGMIQQIQVLRRYRIRIDHPQVSAVALQKLLTYLIPVLDHAPAGAVDVNVCIWHFSGKPHQPARQFPVNAGSGGDSQKYLQISLIQFWFLSITAPGCEIL